MTPRLRSVAVLTGACGVAMALAGCITVLPKAAPVQLYRFGGGATATPPAASAAGAPVVALGAVTLPRAAAADGLLTVTGDEAAYVGGARWVSSAAILMREAAARSLAAESGLRLASTDTPAAARLDLAVSDFQAEYAIPDAPPTVRVALLATLTLRGGATLSRFFTVARPAAENRLSAIVPAYDRAVGDMLAQVAGWARMQAAATR